VGEEYTDSKVVRNLISPTNEGGYTDRWTYIDGQTDNKVIS
jgi:hypothetical protein